MGYDGYGETDKASGEEAIKDAEYKHSRRRVDPDPSKGENGGCESTCSHGIQRACSIREIIGYLAGQVISDSHLLN